MYIAQNSACMQQFRLTLVGECTGNANDTQSDCAPDTGHMARNNNDFDQALQTTNSAVRHVGNSSEG